MKGSVGNFFIWLILALAIGAALIFLTFSFGAKAKENVPIADLLAKYDTDKIANYCDLNCITPPKETCTLVACCGGSVACADKPGLDKCVLDASNNPVEITCAQFYGAKQTPTPTPTTTPPKPQEFVSFGGAFLPGGIINITLPASMKQDYDKKNFTVYLDGGGFSKELCVDAPATTGKCKKDFPQTFDAGKPNITLPYGRNSYNEETKLLAGTPYQVTVNKTLADGTNVTVGTMSNTWSCPPPILYENSYESPDHEPGKNVTFNFSPAFGWINYTLYDISDTSKRANVSVGKVGGWSKGCYDSAGVLQETCDVLIIPPQPGEKNYRFLMPYPNPGVSISISYPVYAKGITIKYPTSSSVVGPLCRSGKKDFVWNCPESTCYENKTTSKTYVYSSLASSFSFGTTYVANPACKYTAREGCSFGCRKIPGAKTAECVNPKPDVWAVFMATRDGATGPVSNESNFNTILGDYAKNKDFLITGRTSHTDPDKYLWVSVVIKNTAPYVDVGKNATIQSNNITVNVTVNNSVLVSPSVMPLLKRYKDSTGWHQISNGLDDQMIGPGEYLEYTTDNIAPTYIYLGTYAGKASENISKTNISAGTILKRDFSYTVYDKRCIDCVSFTASTDCNSCGGRCEWSGVSPESGHCIKKP